MKVLKFGGTSVGTPERMHSLKDIIIADEKRIVVLSALSGTTNTLVEISKAYYKNDAKKAEEIIAGFYEHYQKFINKLYSQSDFLQKGKSIVDEHFALLKSFSNKEFTEADEKVILAQGELMSTALFNNYLSEQKISSILLSALDIVCINEEEEPDLDTIQKKLKQTLGKYPDNNLFITQGYICRNAKGEIDNLKRGGSDYTASLLGAVWECDEIQIWTDIDGMHNNDPRIVKNTFPVAELSFDEAAELAYFGAKILHPATIIPAKRYNVPVRILNTMQPEAKGTLITSDAPKDVIKSISAKDDIIAIKIRSGRMFLAYGFLSKIFEVFEELKTPVDMITTSEVAVSLTIDNPKHLDAIKVKLEELGKVTIDHNQTIICVVGDFIANKPGVILKVIQSLKDIPLRMISYGGSENNISVLIDNEYKSQALNALNDGLFQTKAQIIKS